MPSLRQDHARVPVVLHAGADASLRREVRSELAEAGFDLIERTSLPDVEALCAEGLADLLLLDTALAGAWEFLECADRSSGGLPLVALAAGKDAARALSAGASDCATLPLSSGLLAHRLRMILRCGELERLIGSLAPGPAAGNCLPPREQFVQRLQRALAGARPDREVLAVLRVRIELPCGGQSSRDMTTRNSMLEAMHHRIRECLRDRDSLGHAVEGGQCEMARIDDRDVLVLIGPLDRGQDAYRVARRLHEALRHPLEGRASEGPAEARIGIALFPEEGANAEELLSASEEAVRQTTEQDRVPIHFASTRVNALVFERLTLESSLRHALERGELQLHYQPRVQIATGRVVSLEALLRWRHPELGLIAPAQFIPVAEETGLIVPIGEWVLREACRQNTRWRIEGLPPVRVAVNISSVQFRQPDLLDRISDALQSSDLVADALELELTESMLLHQGEATIATMRQIKDLGVHLAIDDFGTGYSSLSYVKRFPVDTIKIDKSFIRGIPSSSDDAALATSIILMGKSMHLSVVAEGVETRSQLDFLRALECDEAQGFLFSRPAPAEEVGPLVVRGFPACRGS